MDGDEQQHGGMTFDDHNRPSSDAAPSSEQAPEPAREIAPDVAPNVPPEVSSQAPPQVTLQVAPAPSAPNFDARFAAAYLRPPNPLLPEDLRVPWGWPDLVLLVIVALFGTLILSTFLAQGFALSGISLKQLRNGGSENNLFLIINQALLSLILLAYLALQMRLRFRAPFWRSIGWRRLQTGALPRAAAYLGLILSGFLLAVLVSVSSSAFNTKTTMPIEHFFQDRRSALLLMSLGVLLAPVLEETIFRGYIYPVVARSFGVNAGILLTGTLFGLLHASQLWGGWAQIALLVVVGIVFTYARARTHTVVTSYLLHVSYNSSLFLAFIVASHGFRYFPGAH
ncbi:MAG: CPBP family glutamic-type intramembrane protease [Candidatus Acidiferrales bacterium]